LKIYGVEWSGVEWSEVVLGGSNRGELPAAAWRSMEWSGVRLCLAALIEVSCQLQPETVVVVGVKKDSETVYCLPTRLYKQIWKTLYGKMALCLTITSCKIQAYPCFPCVHLTSLFEG
jgi:hypothetical protein